MSDSTPPDQRRYRRPWEDEDAGSDDAEDDATPAESTPDAADDRGNFFDVDGVDLTSAPTALDDFSHDDYVATTTREYQGLAEEVAKASAEDFERQAVAASIPGVGSGLIGFEDVTGQRGVSEEDVEREEQQRASDLTLRVVSGVALASLFFGSLALGGAWFATLVAVVMIVAAGELFASLRKIGLVPVTAFALLGLIGSVIAASIAGPAGIFGVLVATLVVIAFFYGIVPRRNPLENGAVTLMGTAWVSLLAFAVIIGQAEQALPLVLLVVLLTVVFDVGSYFVGRAFGSRPLAPVISPKKTLEGFIGGVFATFVVSAFLSTVPFFEPMTELRDSLLLAAAICILAPLGDAAESIVKRSLDVKDMGSILPGHGGMLDRIDALLFVVPGAYVLFDVLGYL